MKYRVLTVGKSLRVTPEDAAWLKRVSDAERRSESDTLRLALKVLQKIIDRGEEVSV